MEFALAGGVAAYGSAGGAAGGTAVGAFLASNPIGWIIAAVIVIVVVIVVVAVYWDEICNFFSSVGNAISDAAKVIWEFVATPTLPAPPPAIDDRLPAPVPPLPIPITIPIAPPIPIPITKPRTRRREKDIYNVYNLNVGTPGLLRNYTFGAGYVQEFMLSAAIWKYGLTSFKSVRLRYLVMYQLYHGDKDEYIFACLGNGKLLPYEWHLHNVNYATANADEVARIDAYAATHGKLPPGNTFRG